MPDDRTMSAEAEAAFKQYTVDGGLQNLNPAQKWLVIKEICNSAGLDPRSNPISILSQRVKVSKNSDQYKEVQIPYCNRGGCNQLAQIHKLSVKIQERKTTSDELCMVSAICSDASGREMPAIGVTSLANQTGEYKANKMMHAETKAIRRAILNFCGLGYLDETEVQDMDNVTRLPSFRDHANAELAERGEPPMLTKEEAKAAGIKPPSRTKQKADAPAVSETSPTPSETESKPAEPAESSETTQNDPKQEDAPAESGTASDASDRPGLDQQQQLLQVGVGKGKTKEACNQILATFLKENKVVPEGEKMANFRSYWTWDHFKQLVALMEA